MVNFADKDKCTGCSACASVCPKHCIEMKKDKYGFSFPELIESSICIECRACEKVCPILSGKNSEGILPTAYAAYSRDEKLRVESSSGGIFSEISKRILDNKGVVYGAAYNASFEVVHCCVDNVNDLSKLRGAKYSESYLGNTFSEILEDLKHGRNVLFIGTPCQVAGLKAFLKKDYEKLLCIDFVCHGVPSPMAWKAFVEFRAKQDSGGQLPDAINLRSKKTGWSKYQYSNQFLYKNGNEYSEVSSQSLFMKLFVGDYISRLSCENCMFKNYARVSDITIGDFWGIWDIAPEMDDNKGTSVVLVQSEKGRHFWNEIKGDVEYKQVTLEEASKQNPSMLLASKSNPEREQVLETIENSQIAECIKIFMPEKISMRTRLKNKANSLIEKVLK